MTDLPPILCIGAALWDVIGRSPAPMRPGADVAGRMTRQCGGVALNIAMALARQGQRPALLAAIGRDTMGAALVAELNARGVETAYLYRAHDLPTDAYMAIEDPNGLVAAIADSHSMEAAGLRLTDPLRDGRLGTPQAPFMGMIALDSGLTEAQLRDLATDPVLARADLRLVPASNGKAERLRPMLTRPNTTFYVNLEEAGLLCDQRFTTTPQATRAMLAHGVARVLVTGGAAPATDADAHDLITRTPPAVQPRRVTGAGDTFMAAHMAAEHAGQPRAQALEHALQIAADHVATP
ncbi:MAG: bifunctional hydroxymethylpyrimidine kinase/phosphomethylpyrimidine kinase [Rhodobacteraceae bacterium]|nr:bifunctional hydroxymethylpyrimidine kinase/phosphomethylpyrimidine kinase [Paracoccaceae bacterium]TVR45173.1 MAG: kinase [Paracoccaceae bacterium]